MAQLSVTATRSMYNPTVVGEQTEHVAHFHADKLGDRVSGSVIELMLHGTESPTSIRRAGHAGRGGAACTWL
jgi:hypothetical protein